MGVVLILVSIGAFFLFWYKPPTCMDGRKNGNETGVDCGGSCQKICQGQTMPPVILWSRSFEVVPNIYNAVAYVENTNANAVVRRISYRFKIFEEGNVLITERVGETYLLPRHLSVVVEPSINLGERQPVRTLFEFLELPAWEQVAAQDVPQLSVRGSTLENVTQIPRVVATIQNNGSRDLKEVETTAVLFDAEDNAIAASRSLISALLRGESKQVVFTWPRPFLVPVSRVDVEARSPAL